MPPYCETCTTHHTPDEKHGTPVRASADWCQLTGVRILDADGWDRRNFEYSWSEKITAAEFRRRARASTAADSKGWLTLAPPTDPAKQDVPERSVVITTLRDTLADATRLRDTYAAIVADNTRMLEIAQRNVDCLREVHELLTEAPA